MISVKHLIKCYGEFTAVDDLSFEIDEGHVYGFLGPNGAGKSTTMNIIPAVCQRHPVRSRLMVMIFLKSRKKLREQSAICRRFHRFIRMRHQRNILSLLQKRKD